MTDSTTTSAYADQPMYRHYFRQVGGEQRRAVIEHKLGRFPVVDVYELLPIPVPGAASAPKFYLYYGHDEQQALLTAMGERGQVTLGTLLEPLLTEYGVTWADDDSLGDVVNDFLDAFFSLPNADEMEHVTSTWIDQHRDRIVNDMKTRGEWDDVRWFVRPNKLITGLSPAAGPSTLTFTPFVTVEHLSYDSLKVIAAADLGTVAGVAREFIDVMIVVKS